MRQAIRRVRTFSASCAAVSGTDSNTSGSSNRSEGEREAARTSADELCSDNWGQEPKRETDEPAVAETTVVIPSWQRPQWLQKSVQAALNQRPAAFEIVVVLRADDRDSIEVMEQFAVSVTVLYVDGPGHVAPIRAALAHVTTPLIAILDDDAEPYDDRWLSSLTALFEDPRVGCVGSRVDNVGRPRAIVRRNAGRITWYGRIIGNGASRADPAPVSVDTLQECNWAWRTDVLRACEIDKIWDLGDAAMYSVDLCLQAVKMGWKVVFTPYAPVKHFLAPRDGQLLREDHVSRSFAFSRNVTYLALKHYRWRFPAYLVWSLFVGERHQYGLASGTFELITGGRSVRTILASFRGRVAGVREWMIREG